MRALGDSFLVVSRYVDATNYSSFGKAWQWRVSPWPTNFRIWQLLLCCPSRRLRGLFHLQFCIYCIKNIDCCWYKFLERFYILLKKKWVKTAKKWMGYSISGIPKGRLQCGICRARTVPYFLQKTGSVESCYSLLKPWELSERISGSLVSREAYRVCNDWRQEPNASRDTKLPQILSESSQGFKRE